MAIRKDVDWDPKKNRQNILDHDGIDFNEAFTVFNDPFEITRKDVRNSDNETRYQTIGMSSRHRLLLVVFTERGKVTRIISARRATSGEQRLYHEMNEQ